jgi:hypothetical protein
MRTVIGQPCAGAAAALEKRGLEGPAASINPSRRKPSPPLATINPPAANNTIEPIAAQVPIRRARSITGPSSIFTASQPAPCSTTIVTDSRPVSSVKGVNRPSSVPS